MTIAVVFRHLGPGPHPAGSQQSTHGKKGLSVHEDVLDYAEPGSNKPLEITEVNSTGVLPGKEKEGPVFNFHPEATEFLFKEFGSTAISSAEQRAWIAGADALNFYRLRGYLKINKYLRSERFQLEPDPLGKWYGVKEDVAAIDRTMVHELSSDLVVYRGADAKEVHNVGDKRKSLLRCKPGDGFSEFGYTSTTVSKMIGERFARRTALQNMRMPIGVLCRVVLPKGTKCTTTMARFPVRTLNGKLSDAPFDEMEILLPRKSSYRVDSIEEQNGMKVINMTLVKT